MTHLLPRRVVLRSAAVAGGFALTASACSTDEDPSAAEDRPAADAPDDHAVVVRDDGSAVTLPAKGDPTVAASRAVLSRATAVVVSTTTPTDLDPALAVATALGLPLLLTGPELRGELDRLTTRTVIRFGAAEAIGDLGSREVIEGGAVTDLPDLAGLPRAADTGSAVVLLHDGATVPAVLQPLLALTGATPRTVEQVDPRRDEGTRKALSSAAAAPVLAIGDGFGEHFSTRVRTARTAADLPGGGLMPFPGRRMVALYGHPQTKTLGMLGEQGPSASATRAARLVKEFAPLTGETVIPAFELIATVAAAAPMPDDSYSRKTAVEVLLPYVEAAEDAGAYIVLDLQPGRSDFLTQAKIYESLLRRPWVGLALDPEWRLKPGQKHIEQIGSVAIEEVNAVGAWLAELVRTHDLPPKVLTLHQFRTSMVRDRERLDTSLDEIQWLVHVDGQGWQGDKRATWRALQRGLPEGVWLGWKNFEDEDTPMLTHEQTMEQVEPTPWFISYQ
ncbi:MAG: hypothetical protein ABI249_05270 [Ornithinibacter sp.]